MWPLCTEHTLAHHVVEQIRTLPGETPVLNLIQHNDNVTSLMVRLLQVLNQEGN